MSEYFEGVSAVSMIKDCCPVGTEPLGNTLNFVAASLGLKVCREKLNWLFTMGSPFRVMNPASMKLRFQSKSFAIGHIRAGKKSNDSRKEQENMNSRNYSVPLVGRNLVGVQVTCQFPFPCFLVVKGTGNVALFPPTMADCNRVTSNGNGPPPPPRKPEGTMPCPSTAWMLKLTEVPGAYPPGAKVELT